MTEVFNGFLSYQTPDSYHIFLTSIGKHIAIPKDRVASTLGTLDKSCLFQCVSFSLDKQGYHLTFRNSNYCIRATPNVETRRK